MKLTGKNMPVRKSSATKKQLGQVGSVKKTGKGFPIETSEKYPNVGKIPNLKGGSNSLKPITPRKGKKK